MAKENPQPTDPSRAMLFQGWLGLALWMSFGLLLEGLLGYKIPAYLNDVQRRELFQLAHAHGTLLSVVILVAALCLRSFAVELPRPAALALRSGSLLMPLGFLFAGISHPEGDPGVAIWLVPFAALLVIFGAISLAFACRKN
jgi:hypothetical protein